MTKSPPSEPPPKHATMKAFIHREGGLKTKGLLSSSPGFKEPWVFRHAANILQARNANGVASVAPHGTMDGIPLGFDGGNSTSAKGQPKVVPTLGLNTQALWTWFKRTMLNRPSTWLIVTSVILWATSPFVMAAEKPALRTPERTELWVPSDELARVLEKSENKNAVFLTPEQYDALIRDAGRLKPDDLAKPPPTNAVVESIRLKGRVLDGESGFTIHGEISAKALADDWSLVNVKLPWKSVGKLSTKDGALLSVPGDSKKTTTLAAASALSLFVKGPAMHRVEFDCIAPINHGGSPDERVLFFEPTSVPTVLELTLPAGAQITQGPSRETVGDVHRFLLNTGSGTSIIAWRLQPPAGSLASLSTQSLRGACRVAESEIIATYDVVLSSTATDAPAREMAFDVTPAGASVILVEGDKVESWTQMNGTLAVKLSAEARSLQLRVELRVPVTLPEKDTLPVEPPALVLSGAKQVPAIVELGLDEGVEMLELRSSRSLAASVAEWDAASEKATAIIRKVSPRIVVDADARIFVSRDFAEIERILNATSDVPVDHLKVNLAADEEILEVNWQSGPKLEWKRVGQSVEIEWQQRVDARHAGKFTIKSRKKLPAGTQPVTITNITIDDAKKLAGYIALDHDPAWRVALKQTSGLEDRDARLTPVSGKMAWFALREFTLSIELQRRESVVDAEITAYALPRAKSVEIEGQIALDITGAPLRQIEVRVTKEQAKLLRFTSPLIAEQSFDEATGAWKLTLARESTGRVNLRWRISLDGKVAQASNSPDQPPQQDDADGQAGKLSHIQASLPRFELPAARRFRGSWVVEANTDTQLSFATQSLQPVDVIRVPSVEGYTPRHRLVAAFSYGSGAHELTLTAKRHASSELAALVISKLALTSVLGVDGGSKHEAVIDLRHSGEQFAHVRLPSGAELLSIIVDGRAVKPVRGEDGAIAIPLPGGTAGRDTVTTRLIYELPGDPWPGHGTRKLDPITFLGDAPVLATDWRVHVPDGFSYEKVATGMEQTGTELNSSLLDGVRERIRQNEIKRLADRAASSTYGFGSTPPVPPDYQLEVEQELKRRELERSTQAQLDRLLSRPDAKKKANKDSLSMEVADIEKAGKQFEDALRRDPHNAAARRGIERVEQLKSEYFASAGDKTRAQMLAKVDEQWETKVPLASTADPFGSVASPDSYQKEKLDRIIFPVVSFRDATLEDALEFLRVKSRDLDTFEKIPENRGVNMVLQTGDAPVDAKITLDLKDVPMTEALRYVTELAGLKFRIEPKAVMIEPITETSSEQHTRVYEVPENFSGRLGAMSAIEFLKNQGIQFPDGSSASFDGRSSRLAVKNTQPNLDLIERVVQVIINLKADETMPEVFGPSIQLADTTKSGLIPLELDLPSSGQVLRFSGSQAPEVLELRFTSWERQMAWACGLMAVGGLVFAIWGRRRAVLRTLLVVLVLSLGVKLLVEERLPLANAALFGWLVALAIWVVFRICAGISKRTGGVRHVEA